MKFWKYRQDNQSKSRSKFGRFHGKWPRQFYLHKYIVTKFENDVSDIHSRLYTNFCGHTLTVVSLADLLKTSLAIESPDASGV